MVNFFTEETSFKLKNKGLVRRWIRDVIVLESYRSGNLNFIFCNDDFLLDLNIKYLKHRTLTDIITFPDTSKPGYIGGDIFISIQRVKENCSIFGCSFTEELLRVMIHGVLHLTGYDDKSDGEVLKMRERENFHLNRIFLPASSPIIF